MRRHRTNIEGLCDALNEMGIKTSIVGSVATKDSLIAQAIRKTEDARRLAEKEIARISGNAKRTGQYCTLPHDEMKNSTDASEKIRAQPLRVRKLARQLAKAKWDREAPSAPQKRPTPQLKVK